MATDPPKPKSPPKPGAEDHTLIADLSGGQGATRIQDLSGGQQPTVVADLNGERQPDTVATAAPRTGGASVMTQAPGSDVQDAIPTHLSDSNRAKGSTDVTALHVGSGKAPSPDGTHLGEVWGDFQFDRLLGRGGMGSVYLGRQVSLDRQVAIKVLPSHLSGNEQFRERFQLEAKAVAKMSSPHVVQVYAAGTFQGHHYFAMEYVEGEDLSRKLRSGFKPSYRQALDLVIQAAKGLAAAGEHGIVHRDIKPGNMMIDRKSTLKIMDFGLVRLASSGHSLTMTGTVMGTVSYFSPEQGRGEPCDQRTDLYALGVVFYELLTGRLPFTGENATSVIYQHIHSAPKQPRELDPNIPEDYQAVVLKCMQKVAGDRYANAQEMLADLERLAAGQPPVIALERPDLLKTGATIIGSGTFAPPRGGPAHAPRSRTGLVVGLIAAAVAVAGGAGWLAFRAAPPAPPAAPATPPLVTPAAPAVPSAQAPDPELKRMLSELAKRQDQDAARQQLLAKAEGLLADGDYAKAEELLAGVAAQSPGDAQVEAALRRVKAAREQSARLTAAVDAQLAQGDAALGRGDLAAARLAYTAARQIDPRDARPAAKLAELEARGAAPAPVPAEPAKPDEAMSQAKAALTRGDLPEARRLVNVNRGLHAGDPQWAQLAKDLDVAEGRSLLHEAQGAFARGNTELAGKAAAQAQGLIPADPDLKKLLADIEKVEGDRKQRDRTMQEADNLLTEGKPAKAEELLTTLAAKLPEDAQVANALRRAKAEREKSDALQKAVDEQLGQAEAALARADLDAAQLAYTAVRQLDPKNEKAAAGLDAVRARKDAVEALRAKVEAALKAKDLAAAEKAFVELRALAPGSPQVVLVESQLNTAKTEAAEAKRRADELEKARQQQAAALAARIDDLAQPIPELEKAVAAFRADAGDARPELPGLAAKLDDRRGRQAAGELLAAFDAAFKARDGAAIGRLVGDQAFVEKVTALMAMDGAAVSQSLTAYKRDGDKAAATVQAKVASAESPEETLVLSYELAKGENGWRVTAASVQPRDTPVKTP